LTILLLGLTAYHLFNRLQQSGPKPEASAVTRPSLPVMPADTRWDDKSESVLREWEADLKELLGPSGKASQFSAVVAEGETLVTEVVEKSSGVFHLTTLTPSRSTSKTSGEEIITIQSERLTTTLTGDLDRMTAPTVVLTPHSIGSVSVFSDEGLYQMSVSARPVEGGIELRGTVSEQDR
ncbi:MAG: hypothetical protein AAF357_14655, partial [Verrucomicrobiota bacterium]